MLGIDIGKHFCPSHFLELLQKPSSTHNNSFLNELFHIAIGDLNGLDSSLLVQANKLFMEGKLIECEKIVNFLKTSHSHVHSVSYNLLYAQLQLLQKLKQPEKIPKKPSGMFLTDFIL